MRRDSPVHVLWLVPAFHPYIIDDLTALTKISGLRISAATVGRASAVDDAVEIVDLNPWMPTLTEALSDLDLVRACHAYMGVPHTLSDVRDQVYAVRVSLAARRWLSGRQVDIVHNHFAWPKGTCGAAMLTPGIPLVVTLHGEDILQAPDVGYGYTSRACYRATLTKSLRRASTVTVPSSFATLHLARNLRRPTPDPFTLAIVPNGIRTDRFRPAVSGAEMRRRWGVGADLVVLACGNIIPVKGFDRIVEAIARLRKGGSDVELVIVGDGPDSPALKRLTRILGVDGSVSFVGRMSYDEMPACMAACDVLCMHSEVESFSNVCIEAMAAGRPVVGTPVGVLPELLGDESAGLLVPWNDVEGIASALSSLLNPDVRKRMGHAARLLVAERFTVDVRAHRLNRIYRDLL